MTHHISSSGHAVGTVLVSGRYCIHLHDDDRNADVWTLLGYFFGDLHNIRTPGENSKTKKVLTKPSFQCAAFIVFVYVYSG
jgi:hypothetical protein